MAKRIDFSDGRIVHHILQSAIPMLVAQTLNLLYNIVDRIYIARIPETGTAMLGAVGLCFPVIILITAFTNLYGTGGSPLFSIALGEKNREKARTLMCTSFYLEVLTGIFLTVFGLCFASPIMRLFGASEAALPYALQYIRIYLLGTIFSMIATGMNPFINAQGFPTVGMTTVIIGAAANILLDPLFIFVFHLGVRGAALATILSQILSAIFVLYFLTKGKVDIRLRRFSFSELVHSGKMVREIVSLGTASFIMQFTNSLVQISVNNVLVNTGGDVFVSIMTIVNSIRQMMETPVLAIADGSAPVISYNYGARKYASVRKAIRTMSLFLVIYMTAGWAIVQLLPRQIISIFSTDATILEDAVPAVRLYFSTFIFMLGQTIGQTTFKSLNRKKEAIFFSLLRKVVIVVPLTYLLPYAFHMGVKGVFMAEPVSNVLGGMACLTWMCLTVLRQLKEEEYAI